MPAPSFPDPIDRLLAVHAGTRQRLQAALGHEALLPAFAAWFDGPARAAHDILEQRLFPALIESMAGSDAVCLKGMTGGLARDRADLDRRWRQTVRPALDSAATPATGEELAKWAEDCLAWLARTDGELLPMAARLLDDAALDALAADCARLDDGA
ncbi:MAG: hemerythrin domain-containing protein [Castellaniella sp.]